MDHGKGIYQLPDFTESLELSIASVILPAFYMVSETFDLGKSDDFVH